MPDARDLHEGIAVTDAAVADAFAAGLTETEISVHQSGHRAVLEEELVMVVAVPVDLAVEVVAVQALFARNEVVLEIPFLIGLGHEAEHRHHRAVEAPLRNSVQSSTTREYGTTCAVEIAREWIENHAFLKRHLSALRGGNQDDCPLASRICAPSMRLKSPVRKSVAGTENRFVRPERSNVPSQFPKKNSLFFTIGPPKFPPVALRLSSGLWARPEKFSSQVKVRMASLVNPVTPYRENRSSRIS